MWIFRRDKAAIVENAQFTRSLTLRVPAFEIIFNAGTAEKMLRAKLSINQ